MSPGGGVGRDEGAAVVGGATTAVVGGGGAVVVVGGGGGAVVVVTGAAVVVGACVTGVAMVDVVLGTTSCCWKAGFVTTPAPEPDPLCVFGPQAATASGSAMAASHLLRCDIPPSPSLVTEGIGQRISGVSYLSGLLAQPWRRDRYP